MGKVNLTYMIIFVGLAHLEALEMLSNQSDMKVQSLLAALSGEKLTAMHTELEEIKDAFQVEDLDSDELGKGVNGHSKGVNGQTILRYTMKT